MLEKLSKANPAIRSCEGLLERHPRRLADILEIPFEAVEELRKAIQEVMLIRKQKDLVRIQARYGDEDGIVVGAVSAFSMIKHQQSLGGFGRYLSTLSLSLDNLLGGNGIAFGCITQISGKPATGKSQLSLVLAAQHASRQEHTAHYLAGGYGQGCTTALVRRLKHFCSPNNYQTILKNVEFTTVFGAHELFFQLKRIEESVASAPNIPHLVILDSVSGCLATDLQFQRQDRKRNLFKPNYSKHIYGLIKRIRKKVMRLAKLHGVAVFLTNGSVKGAAQNAPSKPALGRIWEPVGDIKVWLDEVSVETGEKKIVKATLQKHPSKDAGGEAEFQISKFGIQDVGDPIRADIVSKRFAEKTNVSNSATTDR